MFPNRDLFRRSRHRHLKKDNIGDEIAGLLNPGPVVNPAANPVVTVVVPATTNPNVVISVAPTIAPGAPAPATPSPSSPATPVPPASSPVSASSSSSSSSSSLTSSSSSSSSTVTTSSTTSSTSRVATPSAVTSTNTFIQVVSNSPAAASITGTPSATPSATSASTSHGVVIGGVVAAILASIGILAAVVYFLRKCRSIEGDPISEEVWNRDVARRQSAAVLEEPMPPRFIDREMGGNSPRPPTMIERHINAGPSYQQPYPVAYGQYDHGASGYYPQPGFGDMATPTSVNPFISPYASETLASPISSTVPDYSEPSPALTRQPSLAQVSQHNSIIDGAAPNDPHYVDLNRSSVTPYQAAQYVEISQKLGTPPPVSLSSVAEQPEPSFTAPTTSASDKGMLAAQAGLGQHLSLPPVTENADPESPFADPVIFNATPTPTQDESQELVFPVPPPAVNGHSRIPSTPPVLPEIHSSRMMSMSPLPEIRVPSRSSSPASSELTLPGIPASAHNTPSPFSTEFQDTRTPPPASVLNRSPLSGPPLQSSPIEPSPLRAGNAQGSKRDTVYTLYDEEDAYGGI